MPDWSPIQANDNLSQKALVTPGLFVTKKLLLRLASVATDLLFPPRCAGCGRIDTHWCKTCSREVDAIPFPGRLEAAEHLSAVAASAPHKGVLREAIQALKYDNARAVAEPLGRRLALCLRQQDWTIDTLIPVPLHTRRLAERGYNQAQLLADQIAKMTGILCQPQALQRIRNTQSQVTVSGAERLNNLQHAFAANPISIQNHVVLLVDDVYTTGSTLSACAEALMAAGAQAVYGLTVTAARI
jgi:ComF family protein